MTIDTSTGKVDEVIHRRLDVEDSRYDEIMRRLAQVEWAPKTTTSILQTTLNHSEDVNKCFKSVLGGVLAQPSACTITPEGNFCSLGRSSQLDWQHIANRFHSSTEWWSSAMISAILDVVQEVIRPSRYYFEGSR